MRFHYVRSSVGIALTAAAGLLAAISATTSQGAETPFTTGGVEARGFAARSSTDLYAATHGGGLFRSANAGTTWTRIAMPGNERYLTAIAAGSGAATYLVVGAEEGLLRTADASAATPTFVKVFSEPVVAVAAGPSGSTTVLAGVKGVGIVRSTDGGLTFTLANNAGFDSTDVKAIAFDPNSASTVYAAMWPDGLGNRGGIFRSTDGGVTWASFQADLPSRYVSSIVVDGSSRVYAGILQVCISPPAPGPCNGAGDLFHRASGAGSWTASANFFGVVSLHRDANDPSFIWAGTRGLGLLRGRGSTNVWYYMFPHDGVQNVLFTGVNAATTIPGNTNLAIQAVKGAGIWRAQNVVAGDFTNATWARVGFKNSADNSGADRVLSATGVAGQSNTVFAGLYAGGVWRSTDAGANWAHPIINQATQVDFAFGTFGGSANPFVSIWELSSSATSANLVYAASGGVGMFYSNDNPGLFRFNGSTWGALGENVVGAYAASPYNGVTEAGIAVNVGQIYGISVNRSNDQVAYASYLTAGFKPGVFRRSGSSWTLALPPATVPGIRSVALAFSNPSVHLALPFDDKATRTIDGGANYTQVSVSQTGFERIRFFAAAENPGSANQWIAGTNKGLFRSADGTNWTRVAAGSVFQQSAITAVGYRSITAFAGDWDGNRYCSTDGGVTWKSAGTKLRAGVLAIRTIGISLYYLTDGAGFIREDGTCA